MEKAGRSADLPSSPWAERFPISSCTYISKNVNHSALAPEVPRINDPKYYDLSPSFTSDELPQSYGDLDKLFWSEDVQREQLWGLDTWQAAALSRYLRFSPTGYVSGGHRPVDRKSVGLVSTPRLDAPLSGLSLQFAGLQLWTTSVGANVERDFAVYYRERIKIDEAKWLPFFRKDRWFDWIQVSHPFAQSQPGRTWSVDDPKVWEVMRPSIELANRILGALIEDKHEGVLTLQTILYGRIDLWSNVSDIFGQAPVNHATVLLSYPTEQMICQKRGIQNCQWDFIPNLTCSEWRDRLIKLFSTLVWGFREGIETAGITIPTPSVDGINHPYASMIHIATRTLDMMLNSNLTLSELCMTQNDLALTMIHELMHAVLMARYRERSYIGNCLKIRRAEDDPIDEPYLDAAGVAETGHYMEQLFFGACQFVHRELTIPVNSKRVSHQGTGFNSLIAFADTKALSPPLVMILKEWPWEEETWPSVPNSSFTQQGHMIVTHFVPMTWVSKLLGESFWRDPAYPRKSDNFFHRNSLFYAESPEMGGGQGPLQWLKPQVRDLRSLPYSYPDDVKVVEAWNTRERLWATFRRPWADDERSKWACSPWGRVVQRELFSEFADAFSKKDAVACFKIADFLVSEVPWEKDVVSYIDSLPSGTDTEKPAWAWHIIGLLMLAATPIHRMRISRKTPSTEWYLEQAPSREAAAAGHQNTIYTHDRLGSEEKSAGPSEIYDHFRFTGNDFTQLDYLALVRDVLLYFKAKHVPVHASFVIVIEHALAELTTDRENLAIFYPGTAHASRWASSWSFQIPEYDPSLAIWANGQWSLAQPAASP
ncbi:hypothetical protein F5Y19DRAFT_482660 [Xylariaceae sp. FL1651]|nr:hypothetical protein F5Y19DRAFT_482660 [Xylariaceae sp. FL1651]